MDTKTFWNLIEDSKTKSKTIDQQIEYITLTLSRLEEQTIIDFEFRFREALDELHTYSMLATANIILGYISDDRFLYFRCGLIAHGRPFVSEILKTPDYLIHANIDTLENGEGFLYITDNAFIRKFGQASDKTLPRDIAESYLDYDGYSEKKGTDWNEENLPDLYPKLWAKYGNDNPVKHAIDELIAKCFDS